MMLNQRSIILSLYYSLLIILFSGCDIQDDNVADAASYVSGTQFNFHQDVNKLYIHAEIMPVADGKILDNVFIEWFGTKKSNNPDSLDLFDDGTQGDIISADNIYTIKFLNDSSIITNILGEDSGSVYLNVIAQYVGNTFQRLDSFKIGNIIPRIIDVTLPDTITRHPGNVITLHTIQATAFDADGLSDIRWVGFTTRHFKNLNGDTLDSLLNKGNYVYLYDDGSQNDLFGPNLTSGDSIAYDGIYTTKLPVFGVSSTVDQTKTGVIRLEFIVQDKEDEYSLSIIDEIFIQ